MLFEANIKAMNHPDLTGIYNISTNTVHLSMNW